jgi:uncharacterized membrane protein YfhO
VLFSPDGVTVSDGTEDGNDATFRAESGAGGTVLLDRLAWAGYSATLDDGTPLEISAAPYGLMLVEIPAGTAGTVSITHEIPGLTLGIAIAAVGLAGAVGFQIIWWRRRPHGVSDPALNIADESEVESSYQI